MPRSPRSSGADFERRSRAARLGWERKRAEFERRSRAARAGWETRRNHNPLRWGKDSLAQRHEVGQEVKDYEDVVEFMAATLEADIELTKAQNALNLAKRNREMLAIYGTTNPKTWQTNLYKAMRDFIEARDAHEGLIRNGREYSVKELYEKWLRLKLKAKDRVEDATEFSNLIALYGSNLGLPMEGKFSVQRFIDSP